MDTETLDKLYLEWSQFTKATTARELRAIAAIERRFPETLDPNLVHSQDMGEALLAAYRDLKKAPTP